MAVLIHGGFWRQRYDLRLEDKLVEDLAGRGYAVWNLEYRRLRFPRRGGWPEMFLDVAEGIDHLAQLDEASLDLDRVYAIGHSAGGHLALWAAARSGLPDGAPGAGPRVALGGAVGQAAVADLEEASRLRLSGGVTKRLLKGSPDALPERYALASPTARVPLGVPQLLVHGEDDGIVPTDISRHHHERATAAGDDCALELVAGEGHFEHLDPASRCWAVAAAWLEERCAA